MNKKELWLKLTHYHFDHLVPVHLWDVIAAKFGGKDASTKAFADKLCRKLDWDRKFALRALWEYKKYVYLGVTSDFVVTPSKVIDQVWHEHLLFSSGYRKFCADVIQYDFDHNPELVPVDSQTEIFQAQYMETIELYKTEFGSAPPDDIWAVTKFDESVPLKGKHSKKKRQYADAGGGGGDSYSSDPLISAFPSMDSSGFEFGGGEFGGGGASGSWGDSDSGSGGDSGGSDGGGSSCSSGCGGCGGGD